MTTTDSLAEGLRARISAAGTAVADTVDADKLVPLVVAEVDRYLAAIEPDPSVRAAMRERPELAARWPLHTGQDWADEGDGGRLRDLSGREWWPPDVTQADAANALQRVQDDAAARVASIMREHGVLWALNVTDGAAVGELRGHGRVHSEPGSWRSDGINYSGPALRVPSAALGLNLSDAPESPDASEPGRATGSGDDIETARYRAWRRLERRWHPVAVAVLVHVERAVLRESPALWLRVLAADTPESRRERFSIRDASRYPPEEHRQHDPLLDDAIRAAFTELATQLAESRDPEATFRAYLLTLGDAGKKAAEHEKRPPFPDRNALPYLAAALWKDRVLPGLRKPASLVRAVYLDTVAFHSRAVEYDPRAPLFLKVGQRRVAAMIGGVVDTEVVTAVLRGLGTLGSVTSHKLLRWEVMTGHERYLAGEAYPNVLEVEGGWSALAERIGIARAGKGEDHAGDVRALVMAQGHYRFSFPDGSQGTMLSYTERRAAGHERARVTLTLGAPMLPGYVNGLPRRSDRRLVPFLREPVPLVGRPNDHGAQLSLSLAIVAFLREHATELVSSGGVPIPDATFLDLAQRVGLPRPLVPKVRGAWLAGDTRAQAFLSQVDSGRYTLGEAHRAEREFIAEGGRRELVAGVAGQNAARTRTARLNRRGRK